MLKFKPILYEEGDFVSYKYIGSACQEGRFCSLASSDINVQKIRPYSGTAGAIIATTDIVARRKYFPIFKEAVDIEDINPTINKGTYIIGFFGKEYEIHESCTESGYASTWTSIGGYACIGSNGKLTPDTKKNHTPYIVGQCIGTFGGAWIRIRTI